MIEAYMSIVAGFQAYANALRDRENGIKPQTEASNHQVFFGELKWHDLKMKSGETRKFDGYTITKA